jgi:poly(hydroxyalkanoate) depolymerase family esterase
MNPRIESWMQEATRLTQGGQLQAATDAILARLTQAPAGPEPADVIDIQARVVRSEAEPGTPAAPGERFIAGRHQGRAGGRDYKLYVPPGATSAPRPLVVMLHGCTQDPDDFAAGTRMNDAARERGWCVLYPAQAQDMNPSRCWNWFKTSHQRRDRGEPEILAGMTLEVMVAHGIDPRRVYVAGLSAGGAMAAILGAAYPDRFAAVGVHSGLPVGAAADANSAFAAMRGAAAAGGEGKAPPTIVFHGDQDATVHPVNGDRVAAVAGRGAQAAAPERLGAQNGRDCTRQRWHDGGGRVVAEHWSVHGAGHAWSGGSARGSHSDVRGPHASAEMLRFFAQHALA